MLFGRAGQGRSGPLDMAFKPSRDAYGSLPTEALVRAVGVGTMSYRLHNDDLPFVDDSVNDPMIAPVG
jgi:hypothetical protein